MLIVVLIPRRGREWGSLELTKLQVEKTAGVGSPKCGVINVVTKTKWCVVPNVKLKDIALLASLDVRFCGYDQTNWEMKIGNTTRTHLMNVEVKFSDEEKLEYSKHIVRALLPALEQFNTEQMIEKQIIRFKHWQIQRLSITSAKNGACTGTTEVKIRDQTNVAMASKWKPKENGTIPCPPKDMRGCSKGTLNLRCIFSENWVSQLLLKAKEIARKCKLKEMHNNSELHYSCSKSKGENDTSDGKLRKAAARENSDDNYVCCPAAVDTQRANLRHFRLHLLKGEPVVLEMNIYPFFKGYMEGRFDSYGWPQLLKLNDWPPSGIFDEWLPRHGAEFSSCLPFIEYAHPQYGYLNLALRLPDNCSKPDLGPKAYIAYGFPKDLGRGDSVTKLHYAVTDTVNVLMHTQAVVPTNEQLSTIEKLKQIHKAQDQREFVADANRMHESKDENKKYSQQSVKADCKTNKEGEEYQYREDSSSLFGQDRPEGFEEADGGALWDVFRRQGIEPWTFVQKLGEAVFVPAGCPHQVRNLKFCINVAVDFVSPENVNECIRLTEEFRKLPRNHDAQVDKLERLNSEAGISTVPSMPKSSVSEDLSSSKTAKREEYVAPNEDEKPRTAEVNRHSPLPVPDHLSSANKAMPGPSMTKYSSVLEDLSSSKIAKREEYVAPSEDEKPRTAEVNLHPPFQFDNVHLSSAEKDQACQNLPPFVLEDLSSSETAKREKYVATSEDEKPRTAEVNLHPPFQFDIIHLSSAEKAEESTSVPSQKLKQSMNIEDVESTFQTVHCFLKSLPEQFQPKIRPPEKQY
ncbi:hypothetical protein RND71_022494 [Anisodus tanguticus]|uniref:JmjC domain-containing protein n=1 Tax=Anisodus tanguticus TaxID=243964 RepID=A0AAE1RTE7_9SOLA|nr:hypothetical protein RND71_022494 [Anisodus tanguticus]